MKTIEQAEVRGKRVIVRVDWNVTLGKAMQIVDDMRIRKTEKTIKRLLENGARQLVLLAHLGKPERVDLSLSLRPVVEYASKVIGEEIGFCESIEKGSEGEGSRVIMLENLRFWGGEQSNDSGFVGKLVKWGEVYVNEAFGESHRTAASIVGIPKYLPSYAGWWLVEEVEAILRVRNQGEQPMVVVMGGAKVEDKMKLIEVLSQKAEVILLGGKLANEFVKKRVRVEGGARIVVPIEGSELLDIGLETQKLFAREIAKAKTVVWNGPMGMVEDPRYQAGTTAIYEAICANEAAYTLVGGGDTLAAIKKQEHLDRIDHISTGGGAMLELIEKGTLPGIEVLKRW